jgi:hypothetical protein
MKTREFEVSTDNIVEFAQILEEHEISNEIVGVNEEDEIVISVSYERDDRNVIFELMELVEGEDDDD